MLFGINDKGFWFHHRTFANAWVQYSVSVVNPLYSKIVLSDKTYWSRSRYKHYASRQLLYVFTQARMDTERGSEHCMHGKDSVEPLHSG